MEDKKQKALDYVNSIPLPDANLPADEIEDIVEVIYAVAEKIVQGGGNLAVYLTILPLLLEAYLGNDKLLGQLQDLTDEEIEDLADIYTKYSLGKDAVKIRQAVKLALHAAYSVTVFLK